MVRWWLNSIPYIAPFLPPPPNTYVEKDGCARAALLRRLLQLVHGVLRHHRVDGGRFDARHVVQAGGAQQQRLAAAGLYDDLCIFAQHKPKQKEIENKREKIVEKRRN